MQDCLQMDWGCRSHKDVLFSAVCLSHSSPAEVSFQRCSLLSLRTNRAGWPTSRGVDRMLPRLLLCSVQKRDGCTHWTWHFNVTSNGAVIHLVPSLPLPESSARSGCHAPLSNSPMGVPGATGTGRLGEWRSGRKALQNPQDSERQRSAPSRVPKIPSAAASSPAGPFIYSSRAIPLMHG